MKLIYNRSEMLSSLDHMPEPPRLVRLSRLLHLSPPLPLVLLQLQLHVLGVRDLGEETKSIVLRLIKLFNEKVQRSMFVVQGVAKVPFRGCMKLQGQVTLALNFAQPCRSHIVQGDTSGSSQGSVDIKTKVPFKY